MARSQRQARSLPHTLLWCPQEGAGECPDTSPGLPATSTNLILQSKHHPASSVRHQNLCFVREDAVAAPREPDLGIPTDKASTHHRDIHISRQLLGHHSCQVKSSWKMMFSFTCGTSHLTCHHCPLVRSNPVLSSGAPAARVSHLAC